MDLFTRSASVRDRVKIWRDGGQRIALVPTAGTLHKGHMSLIAEAQERADRVVVSLFGALQSRDGSMHASDRDLLQKVGPDVVFAPPVQEIYPHGTDLAASVDVPQLAQMFEGANRPGHISEGLTLLLKLLNIVHPDMAVFGERDFQQLVAVRQMVNDLFVPIEIVACATFRESDGLALATGNRQLTLEQRALAPRVYATLRDVGKRLNGGERDFARLEHEALTSLAIAGFQAEYFAIRQAADLAAVRGATRDLVLLAAVKLGAVRLIDNLQVRLIDRF